MRYITSVEKIGIERGIAKGVEKVAIALLKEGASNELIMKSTGYDTNKLRSLQEKITKDHTE